MSDWLSGIGPSELLRRIVARRRNAPREDVEDAIQDVLLAIVQKLRTDRAPVAPLRPDAYLVRAVHNRLTSMQRGRRRQAAGDVGSQDLTERLASPELSPDEVHESEERQRCFAQLVRAFERTGADLDPLPLERAFGALQATLAERLTDQQWILIRMRVLEGMRIVDCARALNVSVGTAHNWTRAALAICRVALEEAGVDAGPLLAEDEGTGGTNAIPAR
jgi:DNA-directed RNA polymerase specialized sigma24 family protein